jgi:hypothetical protein
VGALFLSENWAVPVDSDHPAMLTPLPRRESTPSNASRNTSNDAPR